MQIMPSPIKVNGEICNNSLFCESENTQRICPMWTYPKGGAISHGDKSEKLVPDWLLWALTVVNGNLKYPVHILDYVVDYHIGHNDTKPGYVKPALGVNNR